MDGAEPRQGGPARNRDAVRPFLASLAAGTVTLERIDALADQELLPSSAREEITTVYDFLMQLRLQSQLTAIRAGRPPTGSVQLAKLGHTQRELLRLALAEIAAVQKSIGYEFPEGG